MGHRIIILCPVLMTKGLFVRHKRKIGVLAGIIAVIGAIAVSDSSASVPDSNGMVHACYTTSSGALRVIDTGDSGAGCYSYETPISWPSNVPTLKYFSGSVTVAGNGGVSIVCPDGGIPANLFWSGVSNNAVGGISADTNSSGQLVGISETVNGLSGQNVSYTVVCS